MKCLDTNAVISALNDRPAGARGELITDAIGGARVVGRSHLPQQFLLLRNYRFLPFRLHGSAAIWMIQKRPPRDTAASRNGGSVLRVA
jgi:hypothetical protein